jgi:hypothetical protein
MRRQAIVTGILLSSLAASLPSTATADDAAIRKAIQRGAKYLQDVHQPRADYNGGFYGMGTACLAGLALLEAGVSEDDPALKNIIKFVRQNALSQTKTYEVSLTIMFLDRLGDKADEGFIQFLGYRLLFGQLNSGGWSYDCEYGRLSQKEESRLRAVLPQDSKLTSGVNGNPQKLDPPKKQEPKPEPKAKPRDDLPVDPNAPKPNPMPNPVKRDPAPPAAKKEPAPMNDDKPAIHPEVVKWAKLVNRNGGGGGGGPFGGVADNSNTQFAILGIWCARKHGVPCDRAIESLGKRFRGTQRADGGWSYISGNEGPALMSITTPSMTCAGLIGLAVAYGASHHALRNRTDSPDTGKPAREAIDDPAIKKGLKCLGEFVRNGVANVPAPKELGPGRLRLDQLNTDLYFLWSLERLGVIYGLKTIGNRDWYAWGAEALVANQQRNGSWPPSPGPSKGEEVHTCFAMLFLCKANIAKDLSATLKGRVKDEMAMLKGGGGGGAPEKIPMDPKVVENPKEPAPKETKQTPATVTGGDFDNEASRLSAALVSASADQRPAILVRYRDTKGSVYTEALARSADKLADAAQREVREALGKRLTRMRAITLRDMLKDGNREIRSAAAAACGLKEDRELIPDLIEVIGDKDSLVVVSARTSLKTLSGKDFGPEAEDSNEAKTKAQTAWKEWWKTQEK